ncbi:MAG: SURF1 family protein [Betaproteobacteria bacterium]|nr:SURF1 family protein [Betaproteobacteria bacterium]
MAGLVITLALGMWQLSRAEQKLALQSLMDQRASLATLEGSALDTATLAQDALYRPALLRGRWLASHTVYLDNRQMNAKSGFFVLTPLQLDDSATTVLVQRGWVQRDFNNRSRLPALVTEPDLVEIRGRIAPAPSKLYEFAAESGGAIRQNVDLDAFSREIGVALAPWSLQQTGPAAGGLLREWPQIDTGVAKHHGYAFQWFALSGLIAFLYGWFQIVRRSHKTT